MLRFSSLFSGEETYQGKNYSHKEKLTRKLTQLDVINYQFEGYLTFLLLFN